MNALEHVQAISAAAKALHQERHAWLNPPAPESATEFAPLPEVGEGRRAQRVGVGSDDLHSRTLTNLYNALHAFRRINAEGGRRITPRGDVAADGAGRAIKPAAAAFAPRLHDLHTTLDLAVAAAYGWSPDILTDDEAILSHLLSLNLARAAQTTGGNSP